MTLSIDQKSIRPAVLRNAPADRLRRAIAETLEDRRLMADVGGGLVANYYADANFQNLALARTDATVDFDWGAGSPGANVPAEGFSARWTGQISAPTTGKYTLTADSAGGIKVTVGEKTVIDDSDFHSRRSVSGKFNFTKGEFYDVTIEYQDQGLAAARLLWTPTNGSKHVVPQSNLYRLGTGWVSDGWLDMSVGSGGGINTRSIGGGGSFTSTGDTYTLTASGGSSGLRTISDSDLGRFAYKTLRNDGEITVKLDSVSAGAKANIVFRSSLNDGASFVGLSVSNGKAEVDYRTTDGGSIQSSEVTNVSGPTYLRLKRDGNSFAGYVSTSGADETWKLVGTAGVIMDTFAQVGFEVVAGESNTRAITAASFSNVRVVNLLGLGGNLTKIYDSSPERPYVDLVKLTNQFQLLTGKQAPVDSNGWPTTSDFQANFAGNGSIAAGRYTITFKGPAGASVVTMRSTVKVSKASYNAATGEHIWYADAPAGTPSIGFKFLGMSGWGKNLRVLQPGYSPVNTPIFTDRYINFLKNLNPASIRFMDWTLTNETTMSNWSERSTLGSANWAHKGMAWEAAIALSNIIGANPYINVPGRASNDYVTQLANLFKSQLRADLNVYVEQGNEQWATNFANGPWNYEQALKEVQAGRRAGNDSVLNYDHKPVNLSQTDLYAGGNGIWALRRTARRAKEISDIFKGVFGATAINTRVRVVIAAQVSNLWSYDQMFTFLNDVYGRPGNYIYTMACAPYFTMGKYNDKFSKGQWTTLTKTATKEQLLEAMALSSGSYTKQQKYTDFWSHGKQYGVKLSMYEGGHDTYGPFNIAAKSAATLDPRMKTMMKGYLSAFFAQGGTSFNYYTLGAKAYNLPYGTWAITNDFNNLNTPKAQAFKEVRQGMGVSNVSASAGVFA